MTDELYTQHSAFPEQSIHESAENQQRRDAYRARLAQYLKDPEFRKIEGFPIGTDEAILALSDPPYYTACPNPFLGEIIAGWQEERQALRQELGLDKPAKTGEPAVERYHREPFAADVSEGKNDPIYNAHSYHTKVPHKAIMRYILHYTDPGDIVFDGFCGTGMTGVAAQLCGDKKTVESLGYRVDNKGIIYEGNKAISRLGARKAVLNDLSPAATFIAYNYNTPVDAQQFEREAKRILAEVEKECGWMYETWHPHCDDPNRVKGRINYTVWSDVFRCPHCAKEMVFWDVAVDQAKGNVKDSWECPGCGSLLAKTPQKNSGALRVERVKDTLFDRAIGQAIQQARQVPVMINYSVGKKRFEKRPDEVDFALIKKIEHSDIPNSFPNVRMPEGGESRRNDDIGLTHVHHFYTRRNLWVLSAVFQKTYHKNHLAMVSLIDMLARASKRNRYMPEYGNRHVGVLSGTLYIPTLSEENNLIHTLQNRLKMVDLNNVKSSNYIIETKSSTKSIQENYCNYIFVDPPFGGNLMYSELNYLSESWLKVSTHNQKEAIVNNSQSKNNLEYQTLMELCFSSFYTILKPNHWMTIEFHNSQNSIWNTIQEAVIQSKFVVADVRTLDKQKGTTKQLIYSNATKQDLIISAYKPSADFEHSFALQGGTVNGAWEFIRQHLEQLPMPTVSDNRIQVQGERMPYLLYDRMVAFHLVRGLTVPLSASEFYAGLSQRFLMREGMAFSNAQAFSYDQTRLGVESVQQMALFVTDEASAINWLRTELDPNTGSGAQTYAELQPKFLRQLHQERFEKLPELAVILRQSFLQDSEERWFIPDIAKQADLEALREQALLREFHEATQGTGRIRVFRAEAIRAGFSKAWQEHAYASIIQVAERLPEQALQEDTKLKLYYDNARNRAPREPKQGRLI